MSRVARAIERDETATELHLALGQVVLRMRREPGVAHAVDLWVLFENVRQTLRELGLTPQSHTERAQTAKAVHRIEW